MSALDDAKAHLAKAREYLSAADVELDLGLFTAATSSSVLAGINAKDSICLRTTGRSGRSGNHADAIPELASSGPVGKSLVTTFRRLLQMKSRAQYEKSLISQANAHKAVEWATRMVDAADDLMNS